MSETAFTTEQIIERGLKPWDGGDGPPGDWDRNWKVLHRSGHVGSLNSEEPVFWKHDPEDSDADIIGYPVAALAKARGEGA